ncbi:hypothetical protein [Azorhizobium caulinodans]|nr:hypothetical protein [Azorhizobium caulinodans]
MRFAPFFVLAAALTFAASAQAQTATSSSTGAAPAATTATTAAPKTAAKPKPKRTKIEIVQRSYLDAGTTVKPGSKSYLDYAIPADVRYPTYGAGYYTIVPRPAALPGQFDIPGF